MDIAQLGKDYAKFFVFCCECEQYVPLIDQFRWATTRLALLEAMTLLIENCHESPESIGLSLTPEDWKRFIHYIGNADIELVSDIHMMMVQDIATFELEKIYETNRHLLKLLEGE